MRLAVLVSGALGLHVVKKLIDGAHPVAAIFTDKNSTEIAALAESKGIPLFSGNPRKGKATAFTADKTVDVLVSVNYLFLIEKDLIGWPKKLAFNVHGSLLPRYRGRTPHVWAVINGETETGITAHTIDEDCDTGDVLERIPIPIGAEDTGGMLLEKFKANYPDLVDKVLAGCANGQLKPTAQDETKATYFGKRTPDDGAINWNWQAERIRNWVRAQAAPYPGAFTYWGDEKIIIDRVEPSDLGFRGDMPNGLVLQADPLVIKTPNGAIRVADHRYAGGPIPEKTILDS